MCNAGLLCNNGVLSNLTGGAFFTSISNGTMCNAGLLCNNGVLSNLTGGAFFAGTSNTTTLGVAQTATFASNITQTGGTTVLTGLSVNTISTNFVVASNISSYSLSTTLGYFSTISSGAFYGKHIGDGSLLTGLPAAGISAIPQVLSSLAFYTSSISSANITSAQGYISSLTVDYLAIGSNYGYVNMGDIIATSLSSIAIETQTLTTSNLKVGIVSSLSYIAFPGLQQGYTQSVIAEQSTGTGIQELLVFRGSSASDRIRMQTTGSIVFEPGVGARVFPATPSNATPAMIINASSNVGIGIAAPTVALDVAGAGRFTAVSTQTISTNQVNSSNICNAGFISNNGILSNTTAGAFFQNTSNTGTFGVAGIATLAAATVTALSNSGNFSNAGFISNNGILSNTTAGAFFQNTSNTGTLGVAGTATFASNITQTAGGAYISNAGNLSNGGSATFFSNGTSVASHSTTNAYPFATFKINTAGTNTATPVVPLLLMTGNYGGSIAGGLTQGVGAVLTLGTIPDGGATQEGYRLTGSNSAFYGNVDMRSNTICNIQDLYFANGASFQARTNGHTDLYGKGSNYYFTFQNGNSYFAHMPNQDVNIITAQNMNLNSSNTIYMSSGISAINISGNLDLNNKNITNVNFTRPAAVSTNTISTNNLYANQIYGATGIIYVNNSVYYQGNGIDMGGGNINTVGTYYNSVADMNLSVVGGYSINQTGSNINLNASSINMRGTSNTKVQIGPRQYQGTAADTTTYGLERSRHEIQFAGYRDAQIDKIGSKIVNINKQTYGNSGLRHLIQSADLAFFTVPPDTSDIDNTVERMRITDSGTVGIGVTAPTVSLDVAGAGRFTAISTTTISSGTVYGTFIGNGSGITGISAGAIPAFLSTNNISTGIITASNIRVGTISTNSYVSYPGLAQQYTQSILAEQGTGTGLQEMLIFRGSSASDRIRLQTTGYIVFETGVGARVYPTITSNVTPSWMIDVNGCVGVGIIPSGTASKLDVAGQGRFQNLSTTSIQAGSMNLSVAFV
jgi:hypothetical protein